MSFTKPKIYNLALSALLLSKEVSEIATDTSNDVRILNTHYEVAFWSTLQDLDLDGLSRDLPLELLATLVNEPWNYAYKYPDDCASLRRIKSLQVTDNKETHISKKTGIYNNQKAIFTDEVEAVVDCIPKSVPLAALSGMAGMAVAYRLAFLSAPLIVGKGSKTLRDGLEDAYIVAKGEAQELDSRENFNYEADSLRSEFVKVRLS